MIGHECRPPSAVSLCQLLSPWLAEGLQALAELWKWVRATADSRVLVSTALKTLLLKTSILYTFVLCLYEYLLYLVCTFAVILKYFCANMQQKCDYMYTSNRCLANRFFVRYQPYQLIIVISWTSITRYASLKSPTAPASSICHTKVASLSDHKNPLPKTSMAQLKKGSK